MTTTNGFYALVPIKITDARYSSSTVAEPDPTKLMGDGTTGETVWVTGTNYPVSKRVILTSTHRVYRDLVGGVSNTSPHLDPLRWYDEGPTNKWAWADSQATTQTFCPSGSSFTVQPGSFNVIEFFSLSNVDTVHVEMWDAPGGNLIYDESLTTEEINGTDPHWGLYFVAPDQGDTLQFAGLPVYQDGQVKITLSSNDGLSIGVGLIAFGSYEYLGIGMVGFESVYRDYGYSVTDKWGNTQRVVGAKGKDLRGSVYMSVQDANGVDRTIRNLLDVGAIYSPSQLENYRYLKTWGLLKPATIQAAGSNHVIMSIEIEGYI